jgi:helicase MOV-10
MGLVYISKLDGGFFLFLYAFCISTCILFINCIYYIYSYFLPIIISNPILFKSMLNWEKLTNDRCPAMFIGVLGRHCHTLDSPSFYNEGEMFKILEIVASLLTSTNIEPRVSQDDIVIICAFRAQVLSVREILRHNNFYGISVGQVEDYQGQERRVVIISTVLTGTVPALQLNLKSTRSGLCGLIHDRRRFNVAGT